MNVLGRKGTARDILQGKNSQGKFSNVFISLFIITKLFVKSESLLLFKLN